MRTRSNLLLAAGLAGVALTAGLFVGFRGRELPAGHTVFGLSPAPAKDAFAVVELFTSEGCSSCPPADAVVATIQQEDKQLPVYVLCFHVDYWDRLGWKDAFSDAAWSDRQREYAHWLRLSQIYTPQVVVNGTKELVGSDAATLRRTIADHLQQPAAARLSLTDVRLAGSKVSWQAQAEGAPRDADLVVAVVEHNAVTQVEAGENHGKTLSHIQIVRSLGTSHPDAKGNVAGHLGWPAAMTPADGELIAFLQDPASGRILAATRSAISQ
jgi:hypothetical protein